jgi:glycosyltransferase involved in cell wall biosynthesis
VTRGAPTSERAAASVTAPLRVALDAGPLLDPPTGIGRYVREVGLALEAAGVEVRRYAVSLRGVRDASIARWRAPARLMQVAWRHLGAPSVLRLAGPADVVHATNFVLPPTGPAAGVVTVHDLSFERPDSFPGRGRLRALVPWSVQRARRVLVPTETIAGEVRERYGLAEEKVTVTYEGVSPVFFGATPLAELALGRLGIPGRFCVAVGTLEPRKNLPRLLEAWRRLRAELKAWTLVLAGPRGWGPELPETPGVVMLGWVSDETLPGLLAAADMFCYPSHYEGFGLPPLEAMAAGTAAVVGRYSAAREVLGDAALLVDPDETDDIAGGLSALMEDEALRKRYVLAGRARAARYTWQSTAAATLRAYREAAAEARAS